MKQFYILVLVHCFASVPLFAQEIQTDTAKVVLSEVIVIGKKNQVYQKQAKPLATVDEYLNASGKVEMIKRGGYAWEPMLNSMPTERTVVTIDGMRVFGACTDKMDPITSYVEVSNLSEASVRSGQEGSCHGATIGGSVDLKRNSCEKSDRGWGAVFNSGFESNAAQKIIGAEIKYTDSLYYFNVDFMSRNAENYHAGNNREVLFSQFGKFNISATSGILLHKNKVLEASVIYDKATDVGYPGLPMDVSLAEALITSVKFDYHPAAAVFKDWETKLYYNTITHRMDDTKRPNVAIHMDMPGWSDTFGMYTTATGLSGRHHFKADLNSFYNQSRAEMTMYPKDPNEEIMFMDTWPDVRTAYAAFFLEDDFMVNHNSQLKFSAAIANHSNTIASTTGLESLLIFYPDLKADNSRILKSISGKYSYNKNQFSYGFGIAYGERAPSVSEGYGFYLFNSFDRYDYIGNPKLKNEKSREANLNASYKSTHTLIKLSSSFFHISDYIVAKPDAMLLPMTIGAAGVKKTTALKYADILNAVLDVEYRFATSLKFNVQVVYNYGRDNNNTALPFISPLEYSGSLNYKKQRFNAVLKVEGNDKQRAYSPSYGEDKTPAYAIMGFATGYNFTATQCRFNIKAGVDNLLDAYYSTFSDWNNIPAKGRNLFINFIVSYD